MMRGELSQTKGNTETHWGGDSKKGLPPSGLDGK